MGQRQNTRAPGSRALYPCTDCGGEYPEEHFGVQAAHRHHDNPAWVQQPRVRSHCKRCRSRRYRRPPSMSRVAIAGRLNKAMQGAGLSLKWCPECCRPRPITQAFRSGGRGVCDTCAPIRRRAWHRKMRAEEARVAEKIQRLQEQAP